MQGTSNSTHSGRADRTIRDVYVASVKALYSWLGAEKGLRGRFMFELTASPSTEGTISGTITLTTTQVNDLKLGRFYVQIDSEKAPDGNLWGWILSEEPRR